MSDKPQRVVVCAANAYKDLIVLGARHFDQIMHAQMASNDKALLVKPSAWEQGFIDQWGKFMTREEALEVATAAGQINTRRPKTNPADKLFSEDLY